MEEKKTIKISLSTFFLILAIIVIVIMGVFIFKFYNDKKVADSEVKELESTIDTLEGKINSLEEAIKDDGNSNSVNSEKLENISNNMNSNNIIKTNMSIELAYGILNKYKNENLSDADWYITDVKLIAHGDNNTYWVNYKDYNLDGYEESAATIIQYKDGKWITDLPGFTGTSEEEMSKYNFINYNNEKLEESNKEMSIELAYGILNKYKNENLPDANWYIGRVKLIAYGDNNAYWVTYEEKKLEGYTTTVGAIIQYKDGKWTTDLPGFSGTSEEEMSKYNFVDY